MSKTSRIPGFYNLSLEERRQKLAAITALDEAEIEALAVGLPAEVADHMIENVVGLHSLPLGIATNFIVNGREVLIPMAIEEPSVVAGASLAAKIARAGGGFFANSDAPLRIGQIQVGDAPDPWQARVDILTEREALLAAANEVDPVLLRLGGGARGLEVRVLDSPRGPMVIVHLLYDVRDAMGANAVNTACEQLAPRIEALSGGRVFLRILSNLADHRLTRARVVIPEEALAFGDFSGEAVAEGIEAAWAFAAADPYRAATHNKGIMNGVDAVVVATGNDWRAVEAGAHAYAARNGRYTSLSTWRRDGRGHLVGTLEMPMAVGIVGGATRVHPTVRTALKVLGVKTAAELAQIIVSVGLAQNFAALRALATEGIQRGHMTLHARQVAIAAGAEGELIDLVAEAMVERGIVRIDEARRILEERSKV